MIQRKSIIWGDVLFPGAQHEYLEFISQVVEGHACLILDPKVMRTDVLAQQTLGAKFLTRLLLLCLPETVFFDGNIQGIF